MFLYAGIVKAGASEGFFVTLLPFATIIPEWGLRVVAEGLPYVEIAAGILLLVPVASRIGAMLICVLCCVFIVTIFVALANGIVVACGCFGEEYDEVPSRGRMLMVVVRNLFIFYSAAWIVNSRKLLKFHSAIILFTKNMLKTVKSYVETKKQ